MCKNEIRISKAVQLSQELTLSLEKWRIEAEKLLKNCEIQWYAKLASTTFDYDDKSYRVSPEDIFSKRTYNDYQIGYLHAIFEVLQKDITRDLEELGAKNILNYGFLD